MVKIAALEQVESQVHGSEHPLEPRVRRPIRMQKIRADTFKKDPSPEQIQDPNLGSNLSLFLPAHYFDYIAGTSTGG